MAVTKAGPASRAPSTRPTSVARTIAKRRAKPFKTEQSRVLAKKKKLATQTTYTAAPAGFQYVPVGTPDLSERCKQLSKQKGLPVYIVNAKPVSKHGLNPNKVSHHIHRIGHHFQVNVVEEACQDLGYMYTRGRFVKEADLENQKERSRMAAAMARHGITLDQPAQRETDDQVRAAIKELFPKIPEQDLKEILRHAWAEGSQRVGTISTLDLPRRVQLAVIARIRHAYTDYDYLLRAFDWKDARMQVEPDCLRKLIEWRGENDENDDNELEEVIRETIVIDDDDEDDDENEGPETVVLDDDEPETIIIDDDSDGEGAAGPGYNSDTSLEISHRLAIDEDLGAESNDEHTKKFIERYQLRPRNVQKRDMDVRQKIGAARESLRNGRIAQPLLARPEMVRVHVPESSDGVIEIGGQRYRRVPSTVQTLPPPPSPQYLTRPPPPRSPYASQLVAYSGEPGFVQSRTPSHVQPALHMVHDRPVPSIEPQDDLRRVAMASAAVQHGEVRSGKNRSHPATPESETFDKRRRVDVPPLRVETNNAGQSPRWGKSPTHSWRVPADASRQELVPSSKAAFHPQSSFRPEVRHEQQGPADFHRPTYGVAPTDGRPPELGPAPSPAPYDPQMPLLRLEDYREHGRGSIPTAQQSERDYRRGFVDAQVAPVQYAPHPRQPQEQPVPYHYRPAAEHSFQQYPPVHAQPQVIYVQAPQTPQPVHGAPAAVQQVPREAPPAASALFQQPPGAPAQQQPQLYHGAPALPPQFYYPR